MTGPGEAVSAMQLGGSGEGTQGPGRHSRTAPHFDHRQAEAAPPRGPRAHPGGSGRPQPRRCRQRWQRGECFLHLGPGAHPMVQK